MPSTVGPEHTPHDTHVTAAEDQHGRRGIETIHKDVEGGEDNETPGNNPGVKNDQGTAFDDLPEKVVDGMDHQPSTKDVKESLARAEVSLISGFGGETKANLE